MLEKLNYEEPMMQIISFEAPSIMLLSDINWGGSDSDGDGWTDGWV